VSSGGRPLKAPHRRGPQGPRPIERSAVYVYRLGAWILGSLPVPIARWIVAFMLQLSFFIVPSKRRSVHLNFAHVTGKSPSSLEVRRRSLGAYRSYARYVVELMRLPLMTDDAAEALVDTSNLLPLEAHWKETRRGIILTTPHIGNLEGVARGIARHGWPIAAVADDTSFPELFDHLTRQRETWGVRMIPWRNLRELYRILRRGEILALVIDWGYKADDVPVRLFGTWTTLPAGPAVLAARTGAEIVNVAIRRTADGRAYQIAYGEPMLVHSTEPAEIARATQAIADALEATIAAAPEQWYSFKPQWPETEAERAELAERAALERSGVDAALGAPAEGLATG